MKSDYSTLDAATAQVERDGFSIRPAVVPVCIVLAVGTVRSFHEGIGLILILPGLCVLAIWAFVMLARVVASLGRGAWYRALSLLIAVIGIWPVMVFAAGVGGDYIHFAVAYPVYEFELEATKERLTKPVSFPWLGQGFVGTIQKDRSIVYDTTGEMAAKVGNREIPGYPGNWNKVRHLCGNFYLTELEFY